MADEYINPLPIIADWLEFHEDPDQALTWVSVDRVEIIHWLKTKSLNSNTISPAEVHGLSTDAKIALAADCLIAAGIGRDHEQVQTVYCRASH